MNWLLRSATEAMSLAEDRRILLALGYLGERLAKGHDGGPDTGDRTDLLAELATGDGAAHARVLGMLRDAPVALIPADVAASLLSVVSAMRDRLPELELLLCRWEDLNTAACAEKETVLHWRGLDRVATPSGSTETPVSFQVGASLDRGLVFEANPSIPAQLAPAGASAIRLGLRGKIEASAQATIPIQFGSIGLAADAGGTTQIDWFVARGDDRFLADSFAAAIGALANPFDLQDLTRAFREKRLLGVNLEGGGGLGLGGSVSIGLTHQLGEMLGAAGAKAGIQLGFHSSRRGEFRLGVRPAPAESPDPLAVRVDILRTRAAEDATSASVGLAFDLSRTLEQLRPTLLQKTREARDLLERFQEFIPPSKGIRDALSGELDEAIDKPALRSALRSALGSSGAATELDRLRQNLEGAIDTQTDLWTRDLGHLARDIAARAIDGLPLAPADRDLLDNLSKLAVQRTLERLRADLRGKLRETLGNSGALESLTAALRNAGAKFGPGMDELDALATPVTQQLDRFQVVLARIGEAIRHAGEVKIAARWRNEERRSRGTSIDQSLLFHPERPRSGAFFTQALTGSLDGLFSALADAEADAMGAVTLISGTLQEFANVRKDAGVEIALLDFIDLGQRSLLDADVVVETDASGNIRVCARSESRWSRWRPAERTQFQAVNVFELASARQTRRMSLNLSLSQIHEDLRESEIREFFAGLADPRIGLLAREDLQAAVAKLRQAAPDAGTRRAGELRAWLELDEAALLRLLCIPRPADGPSANPLTPSDERAIYETAIDAMVAGLRTTGSSTDYENLLHYLRSNGYGDDLPHVLKDMRSRSGRHRYKPHPGDDSLLVSGQPEYDRLERVAKRAVALVEAVRAMREIYLAGTHWATLDYQERQERIDASIMFWIRGEVADRGLWALLAGKDSIGPYMIGFFKVIADLCAGTTRAGPPLLLASIVVPLGDRDREFMLVAERPRLPSPSIPSTRSPPTPPPEPAGPPAAGRATEHHAPAPTTESVNRRTQKMPEFVFPMEKKITTYHTNGRRFGSNRPGGRLHAGCDLLAPQHTRVLAMADGVVVRGPYHFYSGTYALEVAHDNGVMVRYGEINQRVPRGVRVGARVRQGGLIATVGRLNSGKSMLHLEMYENAANRDSLTVGGFNRFKRRGDVTDPKPRLDAAPTWETIDQGGAAHERRIAEPREWEGKVDAAKVWTALNVRHQPRIDPVTPPRFQLKAGDAIRVLEAISGGAYPFGQGNLWYRIRYGDKGGFVAAYFIETDYPVAGSRSLDQDAEPGYVSRLTGGLNIRAQPSTDAEVLYKLDLGTEVVVLSQLTGGVYNSNRNDWLLIRAEGHAKEGYAAGFYIDIGASDVPHGGGSPQRANMNRWDQVLVETDWSGASDQTAKGQLGPGNRGGARASQRLAEQDLERVKEVAGILADAAAKFGVPAAVLAAIASRESRCGRALDNGWGDNGNGFGIMQVDRNAHPIRNTSDPCGPNHIEQATGIFADNLEAMLSKPRYGRWEDRYLLQGAVAAYNFGLGNVRTRSGIDEGTTGDDYGGDVLARAKYFYQHEQLHLLRG